MHVDFEGLDMSEQEVMKLVSLGPALGLRIVRSRLLLQVIQFWLPVSILKSLILFLELTEKRCTSNLNSI